eukprot:15972541-Heterocapsa_arctica.AAC.1
MPVFSGNHWEKNSTATQERSQERRTREKLTLKGARAGNGKPTRRLERRKWATTAAKMRAG